jgi:hypothetical protein
MDLKELLGEEMYKQLMEKLGDKAKVAIVSDGQWIPKDKFDQANEAKKQLETDLKDRDTQLTDLKKSAGDNAVLTKQIGDLQEANKQTSLTFETKIKDMSLDSAIEKALQGANAKFPDLLMGKIDRAKIEVLADGTVKGLEDQLKPLKESYKDLFGEERITGSNLNGGGNPNHEQSQSQVSDEEFFRNATKDEKK